MAVTRRGNFIFLRTDSHTYYYDESRPPLGKGAMGIVYHGVDCDTHKPVAIKRVKDEYANIPAIRQRAHLEASLMFSHPNLVEMLGCCEIAHNRGPIFIISEYIDGENMDRFIDRHIRSLPNSEQRICNMFIPVLDALSYIHQKKILHLDIKPSNIMVEKGNNVRLMDLGIANVSKGSTEMSGDMMGTPKYAAPEQFAGNTISKKLSCATDIYEAGVTLYELLTKQNPFITKTIGGARDLHQTISLKKVSTVSPSVLEVLLKATSIYPSDRYQTAEEMKWALQQALLQRGKHSSSLKVVLAVIVSLIVIIGIIALLL